MKKITLFLFFVILVASFFVRLYRINNPVADWHSSRQVDTAAVTRNFVKDGIDLLHPRFDDLSNIASRLDNPQGYRFVEFPLYNAIVAVSFNAFGTFSIEAWGRLINIIASLGTLTFLFLLVKKYLGVRIGLLAAFFFGFLPFNIYYSRTILPDTSMVMAILGGTYFFDTWLAKTTRWHFYVLAIIFTAAAFLLKPYALFFTLPMVYLAYQKWGRQFIIKWELWLFAIIALLPFVLWRNWITQFPEGIPYSAWLFNEGNIRFKGAFFQWILADRVGRLILGYWGVALLVLGIVRKRGKKEGLFFDTFLASSLLYLFVIARGNVQHDYYQILIIPILSVFLAKGADFLLAVPKEYFSRVASYTLFIITVFFMFSFGWYHVRDYFNINNPAIITAGRVVDSLTPKDAKVVAPYGGDTAFLYQTNRQGWASFTYSVPELIERGATHAVILATDGDGKELVKDYPVVFQADEFFLVELRGSDQK